jgi:hypothetical protein
MNSYSLSLASRRKGRVYSYAGTTLPRDRAEAQRRVHEHKDKLVMSDVVWRASEAARQAEASEAREKR